MTPALAVPSRDYEVALRELIARRAARLDGGTSRDPARDRDEMARFQKMLDEHLAKGVEQ